MLTIFWSAISWVFRGVVVKFVILTAVYAVMAVVLPMVISYVAPFLGAASLTSAFSGLGSDVWYYLDFFQLGYGLPLIIAAFVARFLIRRLPVVG